MRPWPVLLLLLATLSGCTTAEQTEPVQGFEAPPGIGNLRGLVVDDAIAPLDGARVVITNLGLETITGIDGMFGVDNLEEGPHRIRVSKADHAAVEVTVQVVAGVTDPETVRVQMARLPGTIPIAVPAVHTGWIGCEALVAYVLQNCDAGSGAFGPSDNHVTLAQPDGVPDAVHVELGWVASQEFAKSLTLTYGTCTGQQYCDPQPPSQSLLCSAWGASPLWCRVNQTSAERSADGFGHQGLRDAKHGVLPGPSLSIHVGADCSHCLPSPYESWGVGLALQQEVDIYTWSFYNFQPPTGWSFVRDGAPEP